MFLPGFVLLPGRLKRHECSFPHWGNWVHPQRAAALKLWMNRAMKERRRGKGIRMILHASRKGNAHKTSHKKADSVTVSAQEKRNAVWNGILTLPGDRNLKTDKACGYHALGHLLQGKDVGKPRQRIKFVMVLWKLSGGGRVSLLERSTRTIQAILRPSRAATSIPSVSDSTSPGSAPWMAPQ